MMTKKQIPIESPENLVEGLAYHVWYSIPISGGGWAVHRGAFSDTFVGFDWKQRPMAVLFAKQDPISWPHITKIIEA